MRDDVFDGFKHVRGACFLRYNLVPWERDLLQYLVDHMPEDEEEARVWLKDEAERRAKGSGPEAQRMRLAMGEPERARSKMPPGAPSLLYM